MHHIQFCPHDLVSYFSLWVASKNSLGEFLFFHWHSIHYDLNSVVIIGTYRDNIGAQYSPFCLLKCSKLMKLEFVKKCDILLNRTFVF